MKAVLQYIDISDDKRWFYGILAANNICVIKEKYCIDFRRKVTISIKDYYELNNLVRELNEKTAYGVSVVRAFEKSFIEKLFGK
jgi:hypothetical protein